MYILYKPVCKDQGILVMNLCVTEDRGITCRYYVGPSLRIEEYIVTSPVTMISFSRTYIFSFINKGP